MAKSSLLYGLSLVFHGALAAGVVGLRQPLHVETIAISVSEAKKKEAPPEPTKVTEDPRPQPARAEVPRPARARAAAPKAAEAPPENAPARSPAFDALPDLGTMGNDGPGGLAIPSPASLAAAPASPVHAAPAPKVLGPRPGGDECEGPPVKPKRRMVSAPPYTSAAREAGVEGLVRVEVTVSASGSVTGARVLAGLGHGLDEVCLEAARRASFEPATRCGKPVAGTAVLPFRFNLKQ